MKALSDVLKIVSAVTSSLLASLRFVIALILALLLPWILGEMAYTVFGSKCYSALGIFFALALVVLLGLTAWRYVQPQKFGVTTAASGNLNILPLALLDLVLIVVAIFISQQLKTPLTTPLLHFCQTICNCS